jgi:DNA modification methylase
VRQLFNHEGVELWQGDCVAGMKELSSESVDLIVTDPPYGINYTSHRAKKGSARQQINVGLSGDCAVDPHWLEEAARLLVDGGAMYMFTRWDVYPQWKEAIEKHLTVKNAIVWVKTNHTAGDLAGNYAYKYELILFAVKGRHIPYWLRRETNVWSEKSLTSSEPRVHPTQKPIGVTGRCIMNGAPPEGMVLDPFVGSGTTLIAAGLLGYKAIGIEIDPKWASVAEERLMSVL